MKFGIQSSASVTSQDFDFRHESKPWLTRTRLWGDPWGGCRARSWFVTEGKDLVRDGRQGLGA